MAGVEERAAAARESCEHDWRAVGFQERTPLVVAVVYVCEKCSGWTYREMRFVGYRLESIEDKIEFIEDKIEESEEGGHQ